MSKNKKTYRNQEITVEDIRKWKESLEKSASNRRDIKLHIRFATPEAAKKWWKDVWIPAFLKAAKKFT
jgi:hypothetical protein